MLAVTQCEMAAETEMGLLDYHLVKAAHEWSLDEREFQWLQEILYAMAEGLL